MLQLPILQVGTRGATPNMGAYQVPCTGTVFETLQLTACDSILSPAYHYVWNTGGNYTDTLHSMVGCDTIYNVHLTVLHATSRKYQRHYLRQLHLAQRLQVWDSTGVYRDIISNSTGCDSFITVNLTILPVAITPLNQAICSGSAIVLAGTRLHELVFISIQLTSSNGCTIAS